MHDQCIPVPECARGGKSVPLKANLDAALELPVSESVQKVVVVQRTGAFVAWGAERNPGTSAGSGGGRT